MHYKSQWELSSLDSAVPSFVFGSPKGELSDEFRIYIDPKNPETNYLTLHSYREWSKRFASGLITAGLQKGDRVLLFSGNKLFTPVVVMGTIMAGGIYNSANPAYTPRELANQIKDSKPRFLLAADNCRERALGAADLAKFPRESVFLFDNIDLWGSKGTEAVPAYHWKYLVAEPEAGRQFEWEELNTPELSNRTAFLVYSSGTTGLPKGVEATHRNIVSNIRQVMHMQSSRNGFVEGRRDLAVVPMYHGLGLVYYCFVSPRSRLQVYLMERYEINEMLGHVQRYKITELLLVPPMLVAIAKNTAVKEGKYDLSSIRNVIAGAAPIGMEVTLQFEEIWGGKLKVRQGWGMSEALCIVFCWHESEKDAPSSTAIGELLPGSEAKIVDDNGIEVPKAGKIGELWIRGPNVMKGYWGNPKATAETFSDGGWLKTGDIAYADEKSKFYIVDRKKELIKVRGAQVAPAELEALLFEHPKILDAAVIGIKTPDGDEAPRAYVVRRDPSVSAQEIKKFVDDRVAKLKRLTGGVIFIDVIPKNPSGKILRRQLRELAAKEEIRLKL